jgi:hypothetical protein
MAHFIQQLSDKILCMTASAVLGAEDVAAFEKAACGLIAKVQKIHVMIILQDFAGFAKGVDAGNLDFYARHGNDIVKMAIVGDPKWKEAALVFTGAGIRKAPVEFFPTAAIAKAQAWIMAG